MVLRLDGIILIALWQIYLPLCKAYPFMIVPLISEQKIEEHGNRWSEPDILESSPIEKRAFDRLDSGGFELYRKRSMPDKRAFDRLELADFDFRKKRAFDRLASAEFDLRRKRAFDRIDDGGFDLRRKRAFDRIDDGGFDLRRKRAFDRIDDGGFDLRKRAFDRLDTGYFGLEKRSSLRENDVTRDELVMDLAQSIRLLNNLNRAEYDE